MKITGVRTTLVSAGSWRNWVLVHVDTDAGISGLGEATLEGKAATVAAAVAEQERYLVGLNPLQIQHHWQAIYRHAFWRGGPVLLSALSGIEIALWDIKGKALNVPIYALLGGACRDRIRAYTHTGSPAHARELADEGWSAVKLVPFVPQDTIVDERQALRAGADLVAAVRAEVGWQVDIMLDGHGRLNPATALELAHMVVPHAPVFLEEPVLPENVEALARVAAKSPIALATGERLFTKWGFQAVISRGLVEYVQPDVCHAGGIFECRSIAAMAEANYIRVAPHNPLGPVSTQACLHLAACIPNFFIQEVVRNDVPWRETLVHPAPRVEEGYFALPSGPGLGIELDEAVAAAHPYEPEDLPRLFHNDGSVSDW